ncbi:MAG: hypothetical protein HP042_06515 [Lachnospiraceae bacterium]|nr:hypothetical protein [Lachnospiraceae bacterium]
MKRLRKMALTVAVVLMICGVGLCAVAVVAGAATGKMYEEFQEVPRLRDIPEKIFKDISDAEHI